MERLVLVDGNAVLHRAYHALPKLTNKKGEPVNALYGFTSMLLKVVNDLKPDFLGIAFDRPGPTFREKLYKEYQATRPKMEEELVSQVDKIHQLVTDLGIPIYEMDGYEADDVIGTIASQASEIQNSKVNNRDLEIIIITGDRDMLQLVNKNIKVYMLVKGLSKAKLYDENEVKENFGFAPFQIVDFKALTGDPSDNYPGVTGIGPKTARILLSHFRTLEQIYENLESSDKKVKISEKVIQALKKGQENARLCKKLATIVRNAPVIFDLDKARWQKDKGKLKMVLKELGFKSLIRRLEGEKQQATGNGKQKKSKQDIQLELF